MKNRIFRYLKHILITFTIIGTLVILFGLYHGASLRYAEDPRMMDWDKDGPYVFYENDSTLQVNYIRGNQHKGFYLDQIAFNARSIIPVHCYFPLDSTQFKFIIKSTIETPTSTYADDQKILAISDIESGYSTFRNFLINNKVIDKNLNWIFGKGHLVLLGDFVDRDFSTTQVLWFIYKLEQDAQQNGGRVHFILGNHELKNMQGNYESSAQKYFHVAAILHKHQQELYHTRSFIGRWLASKNTIEMINGTIFVHGGLHPDLKNYPLTLDTINKIIRKNYYRPYYPSTEKNIEQLLISSHRGIAWYRGYFKDRLNQLDIDQVLAKFGARSIVVGHTLQSKVNSRFNGKVIAIDVKHPKDYSKSFPKPASEGLLIEKGNYYRLLADGEKKNL